MKRLVPSNSLSISPFARVEGVLHGEIGLSLGSPGVNILDPCTGTGNFIVNILRRIPKRDLPRVYNLRWKRIPHRGKLQCT
jgi:hypothetical protein